MIKKITCLFLCAVCILICASCNPNTNINDKINSEEMETYFNECVENIDECLKENDLFDYDSYDHSFLNGVGNIYISFHDGTSLNVYLANSSGVLIKDNGGDENVRYSILYSRSFSDVNEVLNSKNSVMIILQAVLADILDKDVSQTDLEKFLLELKDDVDTSEFSNYEISEKIEKTANFKEIPITYRLMRQVTSDGIEHYNETIKFGERNNNYINLD